MTLKNERDTIVKNVKEVKNMSRMSPLYENIKLNCTIVSDTHIDEKHPFPWLPKWRLKQVLRDAKKSNVPVDALMTVGDTTSRGSTANWEMVKECFEKVPQCAEKIILPMGNHDGWNDDGYEAAMENYYKYYKTICGDELTKPYFSYIIKGYRFIYLGTDSSAGCEAQISDEQLEWFRDEIKADAESRKPVFVFCHQSLNQKHGLPVTWDKDEDYENLSDGGIGEKSEQIEAILKTCPNVYYFSGHSHMGLAGEKTFKEKGFASFEQEGNLTLINLPSLACGNHHGEIKSFCVGVQLEVYDDKVVIRPRSFKTRGWIKSVPLKNSKPYWEDKI